MEVNECGSNPCMNAASCFHYLNLYICGCLNGFQVNEPLYQKYKKNTVALTSRSIVWFSPSPQGINCEIDVDECSSDPCDNSGRCLDGVNQYTCHCLLGFDGVNCEVNVNPCARVSCLNGGQVRQAEYFRIYETYSTFPLSY